MLITLVLFSVLFGSPAWATSLAELSITSYAGYIGLRNCAGNCVFDTGFLATSGLQNFIGCRLYPVYNTCYCNSNIFASASSYLSSCISSACSEDADVPDAVAAWEGYCNSAGFPVNAVAQTTAAGIGSSQSTKAANAPTANAPTAAATVGSSGSARTQVADNSDSSSLRTNTILGGALGGTLLLGLAAIIITYLILRHRRQMKKQQGIGLPISSHSGAGPPPFQPPPSTADHMMKTPVMVNTAPLRTDQARREQWGSGGTQRGSRQNGTAAPGTVSPVNGGNPELQGRPWRPEAEMDAARNFNQGPNVFEMRG